MIWLKVLGCFTVGMVRLLKEYGNKIILSLGHEFSIHLFYNNAQIDLFLVCYNKYFLIIILNLNSRSLDIIFIDFKDI